MSGSCQVSKTYSVGKPRWHHTSSCVGIDEMRDAEHNTRTRVQELWKSRAAPHLNRRNGPVSRDGERENPASAHQRKAFTKAEPSSHVCWAEQHARQMQHTHKKCQV